MGVGAGRSARNQDSMDTGWGSNCGYAQITRSRGVVMWMVGVCGWRKSRGRGGGGGDIFGGWLAASGQTRMAALGRRVSDSHSLAAAGE